MSVAIHPAQQSRKTALIWLGLATAAFSIGLYIIDLRIQRLGGPGIIGFEVAGSRHRAAQIMAEWGSSGREAARWSLWIDYGYMLSYGAFLMVAGFATRDVARRHGWRLLGSLGGFVPYFAVGAALFDASENVALLLTLGGHGGSFAPPFATVCASLKFVLLAGAILYVLVGLAGRLRGSS